MLNGKFIITITLLLFLFAYYMLIHTKTKIKNTDNTDTPKKLIATKRISIVGLVITTILFLFLCYSYLTAKNHGMINANITISEMLYNNNHTPTEDTLPDNLPGSIIILYKYGCKDCHAVYNDLKEITNNTKDIYWISTQSDQGKAFIENVCEGNVTEVPTGVYMRQNTYNNTIRYTIYSLYEQDENKNTVLNETHINRLLFLQSEQR